MTEKDAASAPPEPPRPDPATSNWECGAMEIGGFTCGRPMGHKGMHRKRTPVATPEVGADVSALPLDVEIRQRVVTAMEAIKDTSTDPASRSLAASILEALRLSESGSPTPPGEER